MITGTNFTGATNVSFNIASASFVVNSSTQITATVPLTATTGSISVTTPGGTATSVTPFTVNLLPSAAGTITGTSTVCQGVSGVSYSVVSISGANSYVWEYTGTGATINGTANSITIDFSSGATSGNLTVKGHNDCGDGTVSADYSITVNTLPSGITISPSSATICKNNIQQLTASGGVLNTQSSSIGSGTSYNTSTGYPAPYGAYYESAKHQILILASELNSAGISGSHDITSLAFNVANVNASGIHTDFTIRLANTSLTALTTNFVTTGFTTVYGPTDYQPVTGSNVHSFTTPFAWDGTSNIIVETCFSNDPTGGAVPYILKTLPFIIQQLVLQVYHGHVLIMLMNAH